MGRTPTLLRPERSAHASIRGYLYQACLGVERWLALDEGEALLCEGDEDLDRLVRGTGTGVSEQVKDLTGDAPLRVIRDTLRGFLWAWVTLRRQGETRDFVFTTTADLKPSGGRAREMDVLWTWRDDTRREAVVAQVKGWVLHPSTPDKERAEIEKAVDWLGEEEGRWQAFLGSVTWQFGDPNLEGVRDRIATHLTGTGLPLPDVVDRLVWRVLEASIQAEPKDRVLTSADLEGLLQKARTSLAQWAATPHASRLRQAFSDADALAGVLSSGELDLGKLPKACRTPSRLLRAAYQVVPFEGREAELAEIANWCNDEQPASVQLWFGDGGTGKSRLWIEACRRLRHQGWLAGFLAGSGPTLPEPLFHGTVPRLAVMDYAETRRGLVQTLLERLAGHTSVKVRVVLLARHSRGWWEELAKEPKVDDLVARSPDPRKVRALAPSEESQKVTFSAAVAAFADVLELEAPQGLKLPDLSEDLTGRALYLHMAALLGVLGHAPETTAELLGEILDHERRFWRKELQPSGLLDEIEMEEVDGVVAGLVLRNGARRRLDACEAVGRLLKAPSSGKLTRTLAGALHRLYEGQDGAYLEPLQPDLLGEALVDLALERDSKLLGRALEEADDATRERLLTVLTRLAQQPATITGRPGVRWLERALEGHLESLAKPALGVVLQTGEPLGRTLAAAVRNGGSDEFVRELLRAFDAGRDRAAVAHHEIAGAATERALRLLVESEEQTAEKARLLSNLGVRLSDLGQAEKARSATETAVEIYRQLAQDRPNTFLPEVARSLSNLGVQIADLGHSKQALEATQEAVEIYRQLVHQQPEALLPELARSLHNLGHSLYGLNRGEPALEATLEAVEIYRRLAHQRPETALPELARGLHNLGIILLLLSRPEHALSATKEAVEIRRQLARNRPEAFLPQLATSLDSQGLTLASLDRHKEALSAAREAIQIQRQLASLRPKAFLPELARFLHNLGIWLSVLGHYMEARVASEEALRTLLPFLRERPFAFLDSMKKLLRNYQDWSQKAGHQPDAELVREAEAVLASS